MNKTLHIESIRRVRGLCMAVWMKRASRLSGIVEPIF
jgi:hypothetical protein